MARVTVPSLKSWQLKYWAFLTGLTSAGTKADLQAILQRSLDSVSVCSPAASTRTIVSVDMGIRNLAYCVIRKSAEHEPLTVTTWKRMDLLKDPSRQAPEELINSAVGMESKSFAVLDKTAFTPPSLSQTAYGITRALLEHNPDQVLIERQRFRSGGASAILEWTVRVNMLESMLWACFETLRATQTPESTFPEIHAVSPRRVADFWTAGKDIPLLPPGDMFEDTTDIFKLAGSGRKKVEKSDKVDIVRSWISSSHPDVQLNFIDEAASIAEAFSMPKGGRLLAGGKLDDLADCLLQAVAHIRWQENRERIYKILLKSGT